MKKTKQFDEVFDICLNQIFSGEETIETVLVRYPEFADELRSELEAILWMHNRRDALTMRPGYLATSRNRLVNQIKQKEQNPSIPKKFMVGWKQMVFRLAFAISFLFISTLAYTGGAQAIQASLPGELLYNVKLIAEDVQLSLASNASTEAELGIEFADKRAQEAVSLLEKGRYEDAAAALDAYQRNLSFVTDLIKELDNEPNIRVELAEKLAVTVAEHDERFAIFVTAGEIPGETISLLSSTLAMNDEITHTIVMILEEIDDSAFPVQTSLTPTSTSTPISTQTSISTPTSPAFEKPSETPEPSATPKTVETDTPGPSDTPEASQTPIPVQPTDDAAADKPDPTKKPTKTPKPKKPTKTPKEKKPTKTPKPKKPTKTPKG